ncbi:MAG: tyrosine--tRNA ligase [Puniceicoccales bacterium]|jgi:tyrosyl-tRNA synthetase|nr:tyrosine--tRNA ligase [Puniceicoccales bacterium]
MAAIDIVSQGAQTVVSAEELASKLKSARRLNIKLGVDPTRPDLTFGHMVVFNKLRQFQDLGHTAILLIGDYTATVGDPSGRSAERPQLTKDEVNDNAKTYLAQAFRVLDKDKTVVRRNSEWFSKMTFDDMLLLARKMTVARMLERDDFEKRYKSNVPISIVEFLYPLMQGYDSVVLEADVELGGNDQLFNMLVGRALQKDVGQPEQCVLSMPLLVGLDGVRKMSKSYDNYISFNDSPANMFGKIMSIPDEVMWVYYKLLLMETVEEINEKRALHPMAAKKILANRLVAKLYDQESADRELENFENVFSKGEIPTEMPIFSLKSLADSAGDTNIVNVLANTGLLSASRNEIRRMIEQKALKINGDLMDDINYSLSADGLDPIVIQYGKRVFMKITR